MLVLWLGFLVHRSPRFPGSAWGGLLGVSGATLMLVPLAYSLVKRIRPLKRFVTRRVSMATLLKWHIYAGLAGPILALLHTGHRFHSPLGVALTGTMLMVVVSGFIGRYLMSRVSQEIKEKRQVLAGLESAYGATAAELSVTPERAGLLGLFAGVLSRPLGAVLLARGVVGRESALPARALRVVDAMADVEYAIRTHELFKRLFGYWLKFHIVISLLLYALLGLHVWAGVYFGLRWFR
jgi:hypothetical protein